MVLKDTKILPFSQAYFYCVDYYWKIDNCEWCKKSWVTTLMLILFELYEYLMPSSTIETFESKWGITAIKSYLG